MKPAKDTLHFPQCSTQRCLIRPSPPGEFVFLNVMSPVLNEDFKCFNLPAQSQTTLMTSSALSELCCLSVCHDSASSLLLFSL